MTQLSRLLAAAFLVGAVVFSFASPASARGATVTGTIHPQSWGTKLVVDIPNVSRHAYYVFNAQSACFNRSNQRIHCADLSAQAGQRVQVTWYRDAQNRTQVREARLVK